MTSALMSASLAVAVIGAMAAVSEPGTDADLALVAETTACGTVRLDHAVTLDSSVNDTVSSDEHVSVASDAEFAGLRLFGPHEGTRRDLFVTTLPGVDGVLRAQRVDTTTVEGSPFYETGVLDAGTYTACVLTSGAPVAARLRLPGHGPVVWSDVAPVESSWFLDVQDTPLLRHELGRTRASEHESDVLTFGWAVLEAHASHHAVSCWDRVESDLERDLARPMCLGSDNPQPIVSFIVPRADRAQMYAIGGYIGLPADVVNFTVAQGFTGVADSAGAALFWMDQP